VKSYRPSLRPGELPVWQLGFVTDLGNVSPPRSRRAVMTASLGAVRGVPGSTAVTAPPTSRWEARTVNRRDRVPTGACRA
jgi:hypothetical protein